MGATERRLACLAWLAHVGLVAVVGASDPRDPASEIANFRRVWRPIEGGGSMRPFNDDGWKARMTAFKRLAEAGEAATPALIKALADGDAETRVFATQALSLMPDPRATAALLLALKDEAAAVRLYAVDALSALEKPPPATELKAILKRDSNRDVKSHIRFALERDQGASSGTLRRQLAAYNLAAMDSATVGKLAPDFELTDASGKLYRLADYRGKKRVVLVFVYGDT